jgi:hypothetical protein
VAGFKDRMQSASDLDTLDAMADELRALPEDIATPLYEEYGALRNTLLQA